MQPQWIDDANKFVAGMEAELRADLKAFYRNNEGSHRALAVINQLKALEQRLQTFVRT